MVKVSAQDLSGMGKPISLAQVAAQTWHRIQSAAAPRCPYRIGDSVVGDDPFSGRREGVVAVVRGTTVGVRTAEGISFYDHRQLKPKD